MFICSNCVYVLENKKQTKYIAKSSILDVGVSSEWDSEIASEEQQNQCEMEDFQ